MTRRCRQDRCAPTRRTFGRPVRRAARADAAAGAGGDVHLPQRTERAHHLVPRPRSRHHPPQRADGAGGALRAAGARGRARRRRWGWWALMSEGRTGRGAGCLAQSSRRRLRHSVGHSGTGAPSAPAALRAERVGVARRRTGWYRPPGRSSTPPPGRPTSSVTSCWSTARSAPTPPCCRPRHCAARVRDARRDPTSSRDCPRVRAVPLPSAERLRLPLPESDLPGRRAARRTAGPAAGKHAPHPSHATAAPTRTRLQVASDAGYLGAPVSLKSVLLGYVPVRIHAAILALA